MPIHTPVSTPVHTPAHTLVHTQAHAHVLTHVHTHALMNVYTHVFAMPVYLTVCSSVRYACLGTCLFFAKRTPSI